MGEPDASLVISSLNASSLAPIPPGHALQLGLLPTLDVINRFVRTLLPGTKAMKLLMTFRGNYTKPAVRYQPMNTDFFNDDIFLPPPLRPDAATFGPKAEDHSLSSSLSFLFFLSFSFLLSPPP